MLHAALAPAVCEVTSLAPPALCVLKPVQHQSYLPCSFSSKVLPRARASWWAAKGAHWGGDTAHAAAVRPGKAADTGHCCSEEASPPAAATFNTWGFHSTGMGKSALFCLSLLAVSLLCLELVLSWSWSCLHLAAKWTSSLNPYLKEYTFTAQIVPECQWAARIRPGGTGFLFCANHETIAQTCWISPCGRRGHMRAFQPPCARKVLCGLYKKKRESDSLVAIC